MSIRPARALAAALVMAGTIAGLGTQAQAGPTVATQARSDAPAEATGVIVGYRSSAPESTSMAAADADADQKAEGADTDGADAERRLSTGGVLVDLGEDTTQDELDAVIDEYRADPQVAYVEPDLVMQALAAPNDTEYGRQWDLFEPTGGMNVENAWPLSTGAGQVVAVIDTGYVTHSDLAGQTVAGYDFISNAASANDGGGRDSNPADPGDAYAAFECGTNTAPSDSSWHGTHVAGTIAAATGNAKGIAGIAHSAKVQPVRVLGKCGGTTADIADAITWASGGTVSGAPANATPADVINMSLGGQAACSSTYQNAINGAVSRGTTVVVAAGNSNANVSGFTPASCSNVIAVAATNRAGARAFYSNFGALIDVSAPGGQTRNESDPAGSVTTPQNGIWSTLNAGATGPTTENYEPYMGTSMAAPHIAGLAALVLAKTPSLTPAQVETQIKSTARPLPGPCTGGCGTGIADAVAALGGGTNPGNDFSVSVNPTSRSVAAGASTTATVATAVTSGSAQSATLSATGLPTGATASFSPASVTTGGSSTATIATTASTPAGTYSVSLRATAGSTTRSATLSLTVTGGSGSACTALGNVSTGSLASGQAVNLPSFTAAAGTHRGCLDGPTGTDFDLYLQKSGLFGWSNVASGTTTAADESITYTGTSGTYRYRVLAYSGSGAYTVGRNVT
ncbi:MAG TPA: S8 family peptidase [Iamia sp.]|jgi:serine protease|nr:S8 family peptidase [Iamia sp.]